MNHIPASLFWFGLTGVVYLFQVIPFTGIFLMFVLAPYWSVVLVNLGFVSLAIEAAGGWVSRLWLAAPVLWFGGYAIAVHLGHTTIDRLDAEYRQTNAGHKAVFDPAKHALVFSGDGGGGGEAANLIVERFDVPVAYKEQPKSIARRLENELPDRHGSHRSFRLAAGAHCNHLRTARYRAAEIYPIALPRDGRSATDKTRGNEICRYPTRQAPTLPTVRVSFKHERVKSWLAPFERVRIKIEEPSGRITDLVAGTARPLYWLPLPVMGCFLNSGAARWQCDAEFIRSSMRPLGTDSLNDVPGVDVVATALQLKRSDPFADDRRRAIEAAGLPGIEEYVSSLERLSVDNLDAALANPRLRVTVHDLKGLAEQPTVLAARADAMLDAAPRANRETGRNLLRMVAALPAADFKRIAPRLIDLLQRPLPEADGDKGARRPAGKVEYLDVEREIAERLGDLGGPSLPLFERLIFASGGRINSDHVRGLCRTGAAAAHLSERLAMLVGSAGGTDEKTRDSGRRHTDAFKAIYVTLLRFGRLDLADQLVPADEPEFQQYGPVPVIVSNFPALRRSITAQSPASVCSLEFRPS